MTERTRADANSVRRSAARTNAVTLVLAAGVLSCGGQNPANVETVQRAFSNQFGGEDCPLGAGFGCLDDHESITVSALNFLRSDVLNYVARQNAVFDACNVSSNAIGTDLAILCSAALPFNLLYFGNTAFAHFDNCTFEGSSSATRQNLLAAAGSAMDDISTFNCSSPFRSDCPVGPSTGNLAPTYFAASLHTVQDFYSHTNWVETGLTDKFDDSFGLFPIFSAFDPTAGYSSVSGLAVADEPSSPQPPLHGGRTEAIPQARFGQQSYPALISGVTSGDFMPTAPQDCPKVVSHGQPHYITHEQLAKDDPSHAGYQRAHDLATRQTKHEWCRFMNLVHIAYGDAGTKHVCDQWVADAASMNSACPSLPPEAQCPSCPAGYVACGGGCVSSCGGPETVLGDKQIVFTINPATCDCVCGPPDICAICERYGC